jgi:hypothetical protein
MKSIFLFIIIVSSILSCNPKKSDRVRKTEKYRFSQPSKQTTDTFEFNRDNYKFDYSTIPNKLIDYLKSLDKKYRIPKTTDFDDYYFIEYNEEKTIKKLPFYCKGYFNEDSIPEYAMVLIKDNSMQLIFAFHSNGDTFIPYLLNQQSLETSQNKLFKTVSFIISTETEKKLEGIDTTYFVEFYSIDITEMNESLSYMATWDKLKKKYIDLLFD